MSVQQTFKNQALHVVETVSTANCTTPIDGDIPGNTNPDWTRLSTYNDAETHIYPYNGVNAFVGGFKHTRYALDQPQEIVVFHFTNPEQTLDRTSSNTSQWVIAWTDTHGDWEHRLDTFYRTPSLHDARKIIATLLTNIARADVTEPNWRAAIAEITNQIRTQSVSDYDTDHEQALTQHTPWCDEREAIHHHARTHWKSVKQHREQLLEELKQAIEADEKRGFSIRKALPTTTDTTDELTEAFVTGDLTLDELEAKLETTWEHTDTVPFENALVK